MAETIYVADVIKTRLVFEHMLEDGSGSRSWESSQRSSGGLVP